jgi:non-ribosomal peptide synthetase component F
MLTEAERGELTASQEGPRRDFPERATIHELFEAQAERSPGAVALVFEQERISYGELNERANRLARHLRELGVGPEEIVGIYMDRSVEMVTAIIATLKAGGAYLPIDLLPATAPSVHAGGRGVPGGVDPRLFLRRRARRGEAHRLPRLGAGSDREPQP